MSAYHRGRWLQALVFTVVALSAAAARGGDAERAALEQEYQKGGSPQLLYKLGALYQAEGRSADAIDFFRRYLSDPQVATDDALARTAQKQLNELRATAGELFISGDKGASIFVDDRLRGILPLTLPLFLQVGEHLVTVRSGSKVLTSQVKIEHGRRTDMRFDQSSRAVVVSNPPPIVVLTEVEFLPPEAARRLSVTVDRSVARAGLAPFLAEVALSRVSDACRGTPTFACQEQLAQKSKLDYVLTIKLSALPPAGSGLWQAKVQLFDAQVGDVATRDERTLPIGTAKGLSELAELIDQVLTSGASKPRGTLRMTTEPPGAEIFVGERKLGVTPLSRPGWVGPLELVLRLPGFLDERRSVTLIDQQTTTVEATLQKKPPPAPPPRRPRWRIAAGASAIGVGLILVGFGAAALTLNGRCTEEPAPPLQVCPRLYDTSAPGGALVGVGGGLALAGVMLIAWPPRASR